MPWSGTPYRRPWPPACRASSITPWATGSGYPFFAKHDLAGALADARGENGRVAVSDTLRVKGQSSVFSCK
ncbi:hypothetical protein ABZ725_32680 [Streptomyces sp. NPDC006872]|uniref:hypothetical protein n=1 Tax=Streptomyces sp. NPDC006872 TaxID=3155720 RepID=UPI0033DD5442